MIKKGLKEFNQFVADHPDLLIIRADRGNTTVILNLKDYNDKMYEILSDKNTYMMVKKDPTSKLTTEMRTLLTRWGELKGISINPCIKNCIYRMEIYQNLMDSLHEDVPYPLRLPFKNDCQLHK